MEFRHFSKILVHLYSRQNPTSYFAAYGHYGGTKASKFSLSDRANGGEQLKPP